MSGRNHTDPFNRLFLNADAAKRYAAFRPRDEAVCAAAWKQILLHRPPSRIPLRALVLGPGSGLADAIPLKRAAPAAVISFIGAITADTSQLGTTIATTWEEWLEGPAWNEEAPLSYDLVAACQVFQHAAHWRLLMQAIWRVLGSQGLLVVQQIESDFLEAIQGFDQEPDGSPPQNAFLKSLVEWHRRREYHEGIVWRPHFPTASGLRLRNALTKRGFEYVDAFPTTSGSHTNQVTADDWRAASIAREFGPLKWGEPLSNDAPAADTPPPLNAPLQVTANQTYIWYKKQDQAQPQAGAVIGLGALARLERYTRFDMHEEPSQQQQSPPTKSRFEQRYLTSFAQALIQASLLPVSTRLVLLYFGDLAKAEFRHFQIQTAIVDGRDEKFSRASYLLAEHLAHFNLKPPLTTFLMNTVQQDITLIFRQSPSHTATVKEVFSGAGRGYLFELPAVEGHSGGQPKNCLTPLFAFPPYIYSQYTVPSAACEDSGHDPGSAIAELETALQPLGLPATLARYAHAFRYLLADYDVHLLPLFQLLAERDEPATTRSYTGLGSILLCTERRVNNSVYPKAFSDSASCPPPSALFREQVHAISALAKHFSQVAIIDQFRVTRNAREQLRAAGEKIAAQYGNLLTLYDAGLRIAMVADPLAFDIGTFVRAAALANDVFLSAEQHDVGSITNGGRDSIPTAVTQRLTAARKEIARIVSSSHPDDAAAPFVSAIIKENPSSPLDELLHMKALAHQSALCRLFDSACSARYELRPQPGVEAASLFGQMLVDLQRWCASQRLTIAIDTPSRAGFHSATLSLSAEHPNALLDGAKRWLDGTRERPGGSYDAKTVARVLRGAQGAMTSRALDESLLSGSLTPTERSIDVRIRVRDLLYVKGPGENS